MAPIPRLRAYDGPALLSYGFRPLFLLAALYAGFAILIWLPFVTGHLAVPTAFNPVDWHIHEMLFGYQAAAIGGFLLTMIPNWTGKLPVQGTPLLALVATWLAGRVAITFSALIGWPLAMAIDALFLLLLTAAAAREVIAGRNWRNLKVVIVVLLFLVSNLAFHIEAGLAGGTDYARRFAIGIIVFLVALIAGRIVPSFTHTWLAKRPPGRKPPRFGRMDWIALTTGIVALCQWVVLPEGRTTGLLLALAAGVHFLRLARWAGERCWRNSMLLVLHVGYLFVPLGFSLTAAASVGLVAPAAGLHAWTAGAFGTMTLAVMTRTGLSLTGRPSADTITTRICYALVVTGAIARVCSALGHGPDALLDVAGLSWSVAFLVFVTTYWGVLTSPRLGPKARQS